MNLFQLVLKQMRQRALGTWLTLMSVMLGVALAVAIMILRRESGSLFGQKEYGYDVIIGKKGSATQLVMNTVYHLDVSPGNIPYSLYEDMKTKPQYRQYAKLAVPYMVGDSYQGRYPIVGTSPSMFGFDDDGNKLPPEKVLEFRPDQRYEITDGGRDFLPHKFEAVIGSDIAKQTDLKLGSTFKATHGFPKPGEEPDVHPTVWTVVGVLKPTHTANDRVVFIPFESLYTIGEHDLGMLYQLYLKKGLPPPKETDSDAVKVYTQDPDGTFHLLLDKDAWELSAILIKGRSEFAAQRLMYDVNNLNEAMAVNPALVMRQFFTQFLSGPTLVLLLIALLVTVVAGVGILVSIYNSVSARLREIAILRALGATRARVLLLICVESMLIGLFGGLLGLLVGHALGGVGSFYFNRVVGQGINWVRTDAWEWLYLAVVIVVALIAGLVPAMKAYRTPVATNLVAA
jgi:putative ABC transport system permease protein